METTYGGKNMLKEMRNNQKDIDDIHGSDAFSDVDLRNAHGISYPNRLRKNVLMVRIFNGNLSET